MVVNADTFVLQTYTTMIRTSLMLVTLLLVSSAFAQTQEFKPKDTSYGLDKLRRSKPTKIYISGFEVNFQVYNEKQDYRQGGSMLGGGMRGDALTEISVGLDGLDEATVQGITDQLYQEYINKIKAKGLTIITPDEAGKTDTYNGYERVSGGKITRAEIPGVLTSSPTGFEFFVKGFDKDGKSKKGGFLGNETSLFPKLSKELGDAIIGNVDITILFIQDQEAFKGNGAKIKVKTNLRLISTEGITSTKDAKIKFKGQNEVTMVTSTVAFYHGKVGAGATSVYTGTLGKPLLIPGVIEDEKITSYARGGATQGTATIYGTFYSVENESTKNAKVIAVDPEKYRSSVYDAASKFLSFHTDEFLNSI